MLPELANHLLDNWDRYFSDRDKPEQVNYLGITGSVQGGTTTFLGFVDEEDTPCFLVKIHRDASETERVYAERDVLHYLQSSGGGLSDSVPKLILCERIDGRFVLVQSILKGCPMMAAIAGNGLPELGRAEFNFNLIKEWLVKFNKLRRVKTNPLGDISLYPGTGYVEEFKRVFTVSKDEISFLEGIQTEMSEYIRRKNTGVISHGDFCRHNMLLQENCNAARIGVIDWTFARTVSLPLNDLLFFLSTYFLQIRKHLGIEGFMKAFEETFFTKNDYSNLAERCIHDYCMRMNIELSSLKFHFCMFLVEQSLFEYHQLIKCSKQGGLPRFNVYLSSFGNKNYSEAVKEQLWIHLFHTFFTRRDSFIM